MQDLLSEIEFESVGAMRRLLKAAVVNPLANYMPATMLKSLLRLAKSELACANWSDPGGWRSMVISYNGQSKQIADRILIGSTISMALRNRRRLGAKVLATLIDSVNADPVHVLCLGAGPGQIICDALMQTTRHAHATLVDISPDAFDYGRELAGKAGCAERMKFITGRAQDVRNMLHDAPHVVKMLGICEYLSDQEIVSIASAVSEVMPAGATIVFNSLSRNHGTDRFFRRVFGLHMHHRSSRQLQELMAQGGFEDFISLPEPLGVYHVVVGRKRR